MICKLSVQFKAGFWVCVMAINTHTLRERCSLLISTALPLYISPSKSSSSLSSRFLCEFALLLQIHQISYCSFANIAIRSFTVISLVAMALLIMISFLIVAGHSNARLLMKNNQLTAPDTLSAFHPNPNALFDDDSRLHTAEGHMEKATVEHVQEIISSSSANSATNEEALSFGLTPTITNKYQGESSASNKAMVGNLIMTEQQLSTSSGSPGTDHMHNSLTRNVDKTRHSSGDEDLQTKKSNKRKLGSTSTPSPGSGH